MSLGRALGRGETLSQALAGKLAVTEGVYTADGRVPHRRGEGHRYADQRRGVRCHRGRVSVKDAIEQLMQRPLKAED